MFNTLAQIQQGGNQVVGTSYWALSLHNSHQLPNCPIVLAWPAERIRGELHSGSTQSNVPIGLNLLKMEELDFLEFWLEICWSGVRGWYVTTGRGWRDRFWRVQQGWDWGSRIWQVNSWCNYNFWWWLGQNLSGVQKPAHARHIDVVDGLCVSVDRFSHTGLVLSEEPDKAEQYLFQHIISDDKCEGQ